MRLYQLLDRLETSHSIADCEINGVTADSRQIEAGMLFVCIKGGRFDGHDHAQSAADAGAAAILCERDLGLKNQIVCHDTRYAYGILCGNWYDNPARKLTILGVTGTNGKTTVTSILKHLLGEMGEQVGLIGTIHTEIADVVLPARHTTPDPLVLHSTLARMAGAGCKYVVMECSSHALDQHRLAGIHYKVAAFTNLTQDHLDYHHDMETYYQAKKQLFSMCDTAIINLDDAYGQRLMEEVTCPAISFSLHDDAASYTAKDIRLAPDGSRFMLVGKGQIARIKLPIPGEFSISNAIAAASICLSLGFSIDQVSEALANCPGVLGRIEVLPCDRGYTIIRDYAHSPDGLEKIITTMRQFAAGRVVTLFGCAGNRDRGKRRMMSEIVTRLSDYVILTSDNPREEDEMQIINDAIPGVEEHPETPCKIIPDRYEAIKWALEVAQPNDILILAGKGHEDYQVLKDGTVCFDERKIVAELLEWMRSENK